MICQLEGRSIDYVGMIFRTSQWLPICQYGLEPILDCQYGLVHSTYLYSTFLSCPFFKDVRALYVVLLLPHLTLTTTCKVRKACKVGKAGSKWLAQGQPVNFMICGGRVYEYPKYWTCFEKTVLLHFGQVDSIPLEYQSSQPALPLYCLTVCFCLSICFYWIVYCIYTWSEMLF